LKTLVALFSLAMLSACATAPRGSETADIDPARLSEHVRVLASDPYEGRAPGSAGETRTVAYLVDQFRALGLEPGGPDGQWTQTVPMIRTQLGRPASVAVRQAGETTPLQMPDAVYLSTVRETQRARIENAPMVFVGYGVSAPERGWDDFKDVDLRGRIAVFLVNDPDFEAAAGEPVAGRFGGPTMTYYGRWTYKFEEAARRGAIGALVIHETEGAGYAWNVVQAPGGENYNIVLPAGAQQPVLLQGWIQRGAAEALFRRAGLDFETVKRQARTEAFRPIDLRATFSADIPVETQRIESHNVLARLPGRTHPDETIMYGGHWDAYGIGAPDAQGRRIRPGAADDALGIAGVIEIARAFAVGTRPERSIVFAAWTAEERGLLGSEYYAANPVWPLERTVANFTMDVLQTAGPARDVVRVGRGQSTLEADLEAFARRQGRSVSSETHPERGLFYRADHFPFAKRGVPVLLIMGLAGGSDLVAGGREAGERWVADYTGHCYHQTCDAWSADWDLRGAAQDVALFYAMGRDLAASRRWPDWQQGSEFRSVRARSAAMRR
jgi:Zn-dependent M28 family amino/carboxypeptidase